MINPLNHLLLFVAILCFLTNAEKAKAQEQGILPPLMTWNGKSESLIVKDNNPWITPAEKTDFRFSPSYTATMQWLEKLGTDNSFLKMVTIGQSENGRDIKMIIATSDIDFSEKALAASNKPLILIQAGIHSGEIDGKDAGMMLLRDITKGNKNALLEGVNLLFVPILNVDGHERTGPFNRPNQRGPEMMGWRTNARNLNLNRDYTKLETKGIQTMVEIINTYNPDLYLDIHVTDGVDYQYDITFGYNGDYMYSPQTTLWLDIYFRPQVSNALEAMGHIPGPLVFSVNNEDFSQGYFKFDSSPRYSDGYGNVRHLPTILIENHSLKPFRQRVLGTYVFLEATIQTMTRHHHILQQAIEEDKSRRQENIPLTFKPSEKTDSMLLKGIISRKVFSEITGDSIVAWLGEPILQKVKVLANNEPEVVVQRPKAYWIPTAYEDVIKKLRMHGIEMEITSDAQEVDVEMHRITDPKLASTAFEGRVRVSGNSVIEHHTVEYPAGSAVISTDQPLGDLAIVLLEPNHPDSFFQWGYFLEILERTEYVEPYFMEPYAQKMLTEDPELEAEFKAKIKNDSTFRSNPNQILQWFYSKSPYYDSQYLLYPVGREI